MAAPLLRIPPSENHLPALEGIRGMAVVLVVLSHMSASQVYLHPSLSFRGAGTIGVYLFFVLSSFLLTRQFLLRPPTTLLWTRYWGDYALRRVARIYPLYTLALLSTAVWPLASLALAGKTAPSIPRHLLLLDGYKIFWTIPVEMKFYALLPVLLVGLQVVAGGRAWRGVAFLMLFLFAASMLLPPDGDPRRSVALADYLSLFVFGSASAVCWQGLERRPLPVAVRWTCDASAAVLLVAIVAPWSVGWDLDSSRRVAGAVFGSDTSWFGAAWALFLLATLAGGGIARRVFETAPLRVAGIVSFSAYLWHMPILESLRRPVAAEFGSSMTAPFVLVVIAAASMLSYVVVERPAIRASSRWSRRAESPPAQT